MDRRSFLRNSGFLTVSVAMGGLAGCGSSGSLPAQAMGSGWKFPQSVGSGDPSPEGAVLWTRVVPLTADDVSTTAGLRDVSIRLRVTDGDNRAALGSNAAPAWIAKNVHVWSPYRNA